MLHIECIPSGPFETNAYLVGCTETHKAIIIDPSSGSSENLLSCAKRHEFNIEAIWLTHSHWDHIADVAHLQKLLSLQVYVHASDALNLISPGVDQIPCFIHIEPSTPTDYIEDNQELLIGVHEVKVLHTPGHSVGSCCFYFPKDDVLFSGDTLFRGCMGKVCFHTSSPDSMWISLKQLATLPKNTLVYPGHGPTTTIAQETWLARAEEVFG